MPPDQRAAFDALLVKAGQDRDEVQRELDMLFRILSGVPGDKTKDDPHS